MFRTLKVERSHKFVWILPDRICRLDPKPIRSNFFFQKCLFSLKSGNGSKIRMGVTQRNLQVRPKILKKLLERQIN
jgi:hypothetical protein